MDRAVRGLLGGIAGAGKGMAEVGKAQSEYRMEELKAKTLFDRQTNIATLNNASSEKRVQDQILANAEAAKLSRGQQLDDRAEAKEWEGGKAERDTNAARKVEEMKLGFAATDAYSVYLNSSGDADSPKLRDKFTAEYTNKVLASKGAKPLTEKEKVEAIGNADKALSTLKEDPDAYEKERATLMAQTGVKVPPTDAEVDHFVRQKGYISQALLMKDKTGVDMSGFGADERRAELDKRIAAFTNKEDLLAQAEGITDPINKAYVIEAAGKLPSKKDTADGSKTDEGGTPWIAEGSAPLRDVPGKVKEGLLSIPDRWEDYRKKGAALHDTWNN